MASSMNNLLKWSLNAQDARPEDLAAAQDASPARGGLDQAALAQLLGGPSDADLMREAMAAIKSPEVDLDNKLIAFDNFEQMIENLDNANNMENMKLWVPLVDELKSSEPELQKMAAWCIGTAVQNNIKSQEKCLAVGAVPQLVSIMLSDGPTATRKKAVYALSSTVRNYQPALEALVAQLPPEFRGEDKLDASDMEAVDQLIDRLREHVSK